MKNKVPYNIFHKWYKDTRKKVVEVQINGAPEIGREVLTDFLGDAELKSIMSDGYNAYVFIDDELKSHWLPTNVKFKTN